MGRRLTACQLIRASCLLGIKRRTSLNAGCTLLQTTSTAS